MTGPDDETWNLYASDAQSALTEIEDALLIAERDPADRAQVHRLYRALHTIKGNSAMLGLDRVQRLAHAAEDLAAVVRDEGVPFDDSLATAMLLLVDRLRGVVDLVGRFRRDVRDADIAEPLTAVLIAREGLGGRRNAYPVPAEGYEIWSQRPTMNAAPAPVEPPHDVLRPAEPIPPAEPNAPAEPSAEYVRVDARKIALLMDLAGEVGLACGAVAHHPEVEGLDLAGFSNAAHNLEVLIRELQNEVSGLRLVPVGGAFERMRRVARDTARRTGKRVELAFVGEDTEIDKLMIDSLHDPLVHLVRNAIDHGLETPEARLAAGKGAVGRLVLEASHQGGEVAVSVRDDGHGIDTARVVEKARARGLLGHDANPTEREALELVFAPGFSTRDEVTEVSGRGVGMDVIRTNIESLRGRVRLESILGKGTRVVMNLPLTMAFVDAMVVRSHDYLFALPMEKVFEVFRADPGRMRRNDADGRMMLRVRDSLVPVLWLSQYYGDDDSERLHDRVVVVVQTSRGEVALPVDELLGNQQVMLKPLRGVLRDVRAAAGYGMLRSGDVALTLDCERLHD
jgi:two-component system chemotaxis sensor kinase CheA